MSWCFDLHVFGHLVNHIVPLFQFTSGLCFTNQSYSKNISVSFKSVTTALICSLYLLISTFSSTNHITSPFFVPSVLKTLNDLFISSILILSSLTSYLSIPVWVYLKSTNTCNLNSFLFFVLILVCTFNFLALLFHWFGITYWFWKLLCTKICCIVPTLNLQQNPPSCCYLLYLSLLGSSWSSSFILTYNPLSGVLLCCICNIFSSLCSFWAFCIPLLNVYIYCNCVICKSTHPETTFLQWCHL